MAALSRSEERLVILGLHIGLYTQKLRGTVDDSCLHPMIDDQRSRVALSVFSNEAIMTGER